MDYKNILESFIENSDEGIIVTDNEANIIFYKECNKKNITGIKDKNPIGKNILQVFPQLKKENSTFYSVIKNRKPIINRIQNYKNHISLPVTVVTSTIPIFKEDNIVGVFEIFKDFTLVWELSEKILSLEKEICNSKELRNLHYKTKYSLDNILGEDYRIKELKDIVKKISKVNSPVLIYGETGTGKELFVQAIHSENENKRNTPFIAQNCAALPQNLLEGILFGTEEGSYTGAKERKGLFEIANGGTLYLDEINSLDLELQGKLLRVIQEEEIRTVGGVKNKKIDVKVIASTNENPMDLIRDGKLRKDLYYRLKVIYMEIPPLRERKGDIPLLVKHFLEEYNERFNKSVKSIDSKAMDKFLAHSWPGNVRELKHAVESAMILCEGEFLNKVNIYTQQSNNQVKNIVKEEVYDEGLNECLYHMEREILISAIERSEGNYSKAARLLKIPKQTLQNKIKKFNIKKEIILK